MPSRGANRRGDLISEEPSNGLRTAARCLGWLLLLSLTLPATDRAWAQAPSTEQPAATYSFDVWTTEDGLPINWVYDIEQTRDGYLWLATGAGVARFDGLRFTAFDQSNTPALGTNEIRDLHEAADGTLWIGSESTLTAYRDGHFERYNEAPFGANNIEEDPGGQLWTTARNGIFKIEDDRLIAVPESAWRTPVTADAIDTQAETPILFGNTPFLVGREGVRPLAVPPALKTLRSMIFDRQGHLVATTLSGVWRYETGTWRPLPAMQSLPNVTALYEDRNGILWIGTQTGRLVRWEQETRTQELTLDHAITALYEDREGNLWFGTAGSGLFRRKAATKFTTYTARDGLPEDVIWTVLEDREGTRWFGTDNGLACFRDGRYTTFTTRDGLLHNRVFSLYEDRAGTLWIGTQGGLASYQGERFTRYPIHDAAGNLFPRVSIRGSMLEDRTGTLWAATDHGPARLIDEVLTLVDPATVGRGDRLQVRDLHEDDQGTLWMASETGVLQYANGTFEHLTPTTTGDGTPGGYVQAFHADDTGALWMTTRGQGLVRYRDGQFHTLTTEHGLFDDIIHHLVEDDQGWFWMTTNRGIFRVRKADLHAVADGTAPFVTSVVYGTADGLRSVENNSGFPGPWQSTDGRIWFPTMQGVAVIDPNNFPRNEVPPAVVIEELLVDYQPVALDAEITLPPETQGLAVTYTGLSFTAPDKVHFQYRLDGYDADWVDAGARRTAFYTNIPPGSYTFRVKAANNDGVWNETGAAVSFVLKPHIYETGWFYGLMGLVVLLAGVGGYRYRLRQLRERELVALVEERTAGLQAEKQKTEAQAQKLAEMDAFKTRFFANLSHELRTPLTLTIGPLDDLVRHPETPVTPAHLRGPLRNARRLLTLINQLLDIAKLEAGKMTLRAREHDLVAFARTRTEAFASLAERKEIRLSFQAETDALPVYFEDDKLEKVIYNLISNAIKYTPAHGKIHVAIAAQEGAAVLTVKDTGTGIPKDNLPHVFDRFFQVEDTREHRPASTGIGLSLTKELVDLHGGAIGVESDVGFGSIFTVTLPLGRAHLADGDLVDEWEGEDERGMIVEEEPVEATTPTPSNGQATETILIVEDNEEMRAFIAGPLADHYAVLEAADGAAGLDVACEQVPDLIISDVMMPEMDGFALCRTLKTDERTSHIPVILLTARAGDESKIKGLETGADAYLAKPFNARELHVRVEQLIAQRKRLRARFSQGRLVLQPTDLGVTSADEAFLQRAQAAAEEHMAENGFGVFELADTLGLSRRQLHRKLTALTGFGPADFLRQLRLERAAQLLRQDYGTVAEVAYQVGFNKPKHFSRLFRDHFGVNPSAYNGTEEET